MQEAYSPETKQGRAATGPVTFTYTCLLLAFVVTAAPITSSLWLDETATYWVVKDGLADVVARSWEWSGQSALYYVIAWIAGHVAPYVGWEVALRLPSLVAMLIAAVLLYRLGRYLMDARAGMLAALALLAVPGVSFAAIDARPYALGLALVIGSMLCFLRWLDTGRPLFAALYVVTSALVVYAHYLFALGLVAQLVFGLHRARRLAPLWAAIGLLCLPLVGQVLNFYRSRQAHSVGIYSPGVDLFFIAIAPPVLVGAVLFSFIVSKRTVGLGQFRVPWQLLFAWLIFPPAFLFLLSFTHTKLFLPRYYLTCAPAAALLAGYAIARISAVRTGSAVLALSMAVGIWQAGPLHGGEDWRGAMRTVDAQASSEDAVLVTTGFVEGTREETNGPRLRDVLYSPQLLYPVKHFLRLPFHFEEEAIPGDLAQFRRVFLITRQTTPGGQYAATQYECRLKQKLAGYRSQDLGNFGGVSVVRFER